jgi:hypothetical protein
MAVSSFSNFPRFVSRFLSPWTVVALLLLKPSILATPQAPVLLTLTGQETLLLQPLANAQETTGGVDLSSQAVSQLPLNKRDFSQLLLLAAGTMTDAVHLRRRPHVHPEHGAGSAWGGSELP